MVLKLKLNLYRKLKTIKKKKQNQNTITTLSHVNYPSSALQHIERVQQYK